MAALRRCDSLLILKKVLPACRRLSTIKINSSNGLSRNIINHGYYCKYNNLYKVTFLGNYCRPSNSITNVRSMTFKSVLSGIEKTDQDHAKDEKSESDKQKEKELEQRWKVWKSRLTKFTIGLLVVSIGGTIWTLGEPPTDDDGNVMEEDVAKDYEYEVIRRLYRCYRVISRLRHDIIEPSREKLLPDPLQYPYIQPRYTLVMEMTGVLVHPDWTFNSGWRFKKRPGVEYFLKTVGPPLFETVVYTSENGMTAEMIINTLDPDSHIMYRLYRDTTRYMDGIHVKDLSYLNRDLSKVIFLDWNKDCFKLQTSNGLLLKKYTGDDDDNVMVDLAHFLQAIAISQVDDVRPVLDYYSQFDDPLEKFKENQAKLQAEQEKLAIQQNQQQHSRFSFISRMVNKS